MLSYQILSNVKTSVRSAVHSRNIGILAPCLQKATDPIQQLFVDKIREYKQKSNKRLHLSAPGYKNEICWKRKPCHFVCDDIKGLMEEHLSSKRGKNLVEPTPELQKELSQELEKVSKQYGGGSGVDMTKFPELKFQDPVIDPINLETK